MANLAAAPPARTPSHQDPLGAVTGAAAEPYSTVGLTGTK